MAESNAQQELRRQLFDGTVKGFAAKDYKFKQAVLISPTSAWKNYFWRETSDPITDTTLNASKGIPRGADFPQGSPTNTRVLSTIEKYGFEDKIPWEDLISDEVNVRERTSFRISERVTKSVDAEIYSVLSEGNTAVNIQEVEITGSAALARTWDVASAQIMDNLMEAAQKISEKNYPIDNLMLFVTPRDYRSIMHYIYEKGAQAPKAGEAIAGNGRVAGFGPIKTIVVTDTVTTSFALVVVPKRCATWKALKPLNTVTIEDPMKDLTVRSAEMGVTQLTDPKCVVQIKGTQLW